MTCLSALLFLCAATSAAVSAFPIVIRDSPVSLPFARRFMFKFLGASTLIEQDPPARVLKNVVYGKGAGHSLRQSDVSAANKETHYTLDGGVGTPPTNYTLLIDTGSSNTLVGTGKSYVETSTSPEDIGNSVSGDEYSDTVTLSTDLVVTSQGIGVANSSISSIGPTALTADATPDGSLAPTVLDNAYSQGLITSSGATPGKYPWVTNQSTSRSLLGWC
ncbi:hypothetical protein V8D89_010606 [Ganoderma adspersum]